MKGCMQWNLMFGKILASSGTTGSAGQNLTSRAIKISAGRWGFLFQNDPESIDPSLIYKMNLDFWGCYEEKKSQSYNQTSRIIIVPSP